MKDKIGKFFRKPFFHNYRTIAALWALLALIAAITKGGFSGGKLNNFLIFRGVFHHLTDLVSLYAYYPEEYTDHNLYGPVFSVIIAPFAVMPKFLGLLLWLLTLAGTYLWAVIKAPLSHNAKIILLWFVTNEIISAMQMAQFNIAIATLIIAAFTAIHQGRISWAALFVVLGTFTKIYGAIAIVLILFTQKKLKFIGWICFWSVMAICIPMFISSPEYVIGQYVEWIQTILAKNQQNIEVGFNTVSNYYQNISVMGMIHRITQLQFSDLWVLCPAAIIFILPLFRHNQWNAKAFQWGIVASSLMCIILFSTSSESSGYIIALSGVAIWYLSSPWKRTGFDLFLLFFVLVISSFGTSDLMPSPIKRGLIRPYSLKALPVLIVWLKLNWELLTKNYHKQSHHQANKNLTS